MMEFSDKYGTEDKINRGIMLTRSVILLVIGFFHASSLPEARLGTWQD